MKRIIENKWGLKDPLSGEELLQRIEEMQNKIKDLLYQNHVSAEKKWILIIF
ncbi:hypothetical protein [Thermoactinomyces vulgaris]|uniref:hypothetical protein n=1 Tax=Thermoactinomyces vulgaris TaxID=2026 RepID=UPI0015EE7216|nr:hypothetical protein [Thermoactinomyces vulgaris]